eukprot:1159077-Pelagomonas_calceolata.AAC.8
MCKWPVYQYIVARTWVSRMRADELNHASIIDGIRLCKVCAVVSYINRTNRKASLGRRTYRTLTCLNATVPHTLLHFCQDDIT